MNSMRSIFETKRARLLFLSITFLGISHVVTQLVVIREFLNVFYGNELVFGIILANWLLLMGIGSWLGKFAKRMKSKMELLILSQISIALLPFLSIFLIRALRNWIFIPGVAVDISGIFLSSFFILLPFCLLSGFLLTLACSVFSLRRTEEQIGKVYFIDNIGDILGGVLFSFVLVFWLNPCQMAFVIMFVNLLAAMVLSNFINRRFLSGFVVVLLALSTISCFAFDMDGITTAMMFPGQALVHQETSPYGKIVITRTGNQLNFFENGLPLFSTENRISNEETVHYAMVQHDDPKDILVISGGVAGTIDEILKYDVRKIDYVELDPLITRLGGQYTTNLDNAIEGNKLNIINGDGRFYVKRTENRYDVVIVDLPDPGTAQVNRFYTLQFFQELHKILNPGSIISISLSSSINYMNPETIKLNSILYNTLKAVFSNVIVIPGDENYFIATDSDLTYDIAEKIKEKNIRTLYVNENYLSGKLTRDRIDYVLDSIKKEKAGLSLNTDFMPITYYYHLLCWLSHFEVNLTPFLIASVAILIIILFRMGSLSFAMSTTGFAAASLEVVVLISFQILYGYVYQNMGVIVTAFMLGLAIGAYKMNNWLKTKSKPDFVKIEMSIFIYCLLLPLFLISLASLENAALVFLSSQIIFPALTLIIAVLVGMEFPLAGKLHLHKKEVEHTAGTLYASDLAGACIGALLTAALLIPVLGIVNVCILAGFLNLISGVLVWKKL